MEKNRFEFVLNACSRCASVVLGVLVALMVSEGFARFYTFLDRPPQSHYELFDAKILVAEHLAPSVVTHPLIVLMGDSLMTRGIFPELLEARLREQGVPATVANLAVSGTPPNVAARELDYLLKRVKSKPDLVLYNFEPMNTNLATYTLAQDEIMESLLERTYFGRCVSPEKDVSSGLICALERHSNLLRNRRHILRRVKEFLATVFDENRFHYASSTNLTDGVNTEVSRKGSAPVHSTINQELVQQRLEHYKQEFFRFGPRNEEFLFGMDHYDSISKFTEQHGIDFGLVWLPHLKDWYQKYFYTSEHDRGWFIKKAQAYVAETPRRHFYDLNYLSDSYTYYDDFRHLNAFGAYEATNLLATALLHGPLQRYKVPPL